MFLCAGGEEVELLAAKLKQAKAETAEAESGLSTTLEKVRELEELNEKVKAEVASAAAETGKEAVAAADLRREVKRLTEENTALAPCATTQRMLSDLVPC